MNRLFSSLLSESASTLSGVADAVFLRYLFLAVLAYAAAVSILAWFLSRGFRQEARAPESAPSGLNHTTGAAVLLAGFGIAAVLFFISLRGFMDFQVPPNSAYLITGKADGSLWTFSYLEGAVSDTLIVPANRPVNLTLSASDAAHDFSIPAFRIRSVIMPGKSDSVWFQSILPGKVNMLSTCFGTLGHTTAVYPVLSLEQEAYSKWVAVKSDPSIGKTPEEYGEIVYKQSGCSACHSLDGTAKDGPTFKGLFESQRLLVSGDSVVANEEYIRSSVLEPNAQVAAGFTPVMQAYDLKDKEINALAAFLKTLK